MQANCRNSPESVPQNQSYPWQQRDGIGLIGDQSFFRRYLNELINKMPCGRRLTSKLGARGVFQNTPAFRKLTNLF